MPGCALCKLSREDSSIFRPESIAVLIAIAACLGVSVEKFGDGDGQLGYLSL